MIKGVGLSNFDEPITSVRRGSLGSFRVRESTSAENERVLDVKLW